MKVFVELKLRWRLIWGTGAWLRGTPGPEIIEELIPQPRRCRCRRKEDS